MRSGVILNPYEALPSAKRSFLAHGCHLTKPHPVEEEIVSLLYIFYKVRKGYFVGFLYVRVPIHPFNTKYIRYRKTTSLFEMQKRTLDFLFELFKVFNFW